MSPNLGLSSVFSWSAWGVWGFRKDPTARTYPCHLLTARPSHPGHLSKAACAVFFVTLLSFTFRGLSAARSRSPAHTQGQEISFSLGEGGVQGAPIETTTVINTVGDTRRLYRHGSPEHVVHGFQDLSVGTACSVCMVGFYASLISSTFVTWDSAVRKTSPLFSPVLFRPVPYLAFVLLNCSHSSKVTWVKPPLSPTSSEYVAYMSNPSRLIYHNLHSRLESLQNPGWFYFNVHTATY